MKLGTFIMGCALALPACMLAGCDDRLEVRQAYDFSLSSWYLQEGIEPDETVEIRLTLDREGDYREAVTASGTYSWRVTARCSPRMEPGW